MRPHQQAKVDARHTAALAEKKGLLKKQSCFGCGSSDTEKHHEDYSKPLEVTWMCRQCHLEYHQWKERRQAA
jgi:hypothetical protein